MPATESLISGMAFKSPPTVCKLMSDYDKDTELLRRPAAMKQLFDTETKERTTREPMNQPNPEKPRETTMIQDHEQKRDKKMEMLETLITNQANELTNQANELKGMTKNIEAIMLMMMRQNDEPVSAPTTPSAPTTKTLPTTPSHIKEIDYSFMDMAEGNPRSSALGAISISELDADTGARYSTPRLRINKMQPLVDHFRKYEPAFIERIATAARLHGLSRVDELLMVLKSTKSDYGFNENLANAFLWSCLSDENLAADTAGQLESVLIEYLCVQEEELSNWLESCAQ